MNRVWLDFVMKVRLPIVVAVGAAAFMVTYFVSNAEREGVGYAPEQPIPFSHKRHAGEMKIDCRYCHIGADQSRHAVVPSVDTCMNCHSLARTDSPWIQQLKKFADEGKPIPWKRVHQVPEFVYFNHSVHVNKGITCQTCHGPVEQMDKIEQVRPFAMSNCLHCHRNAHEELQGITDLSQIKKGPENCSACHR